MPKGDPKYRDAMADKSNGDRLLARSATAPMPPLPAPWIIESLMEIGPVEANGMGVSPIGWTTIYHWSRLTCTPVAPWEARLLRRLSRDFITERGKAEDGGPMPYSDEPIAVDLDANEARLRMAFGI